MLDDVDINKIIVFKKVSFGKKKKIKYFIGHKDNEKVKPLCAMLPKISGCK